MLAGLLVLLGFGSGANAFSFLSIGDWGDSEAKKVAPEMGKYSPEFVLALGMFRTAKQ